MLIIIVTVTMDKNTFESMFGGLFAGADLTGAQIILNNESGGTVINHNHSCSNNEIPHFPLDGRPSEGKMVFQQLIDSGFIAADTDEASFLYIMGYSSEMNGNIKKIVWLKSKQLARECFLLRNEKAINSKQLKIKKKEKMITQLFLYKGKPLELSKNRMEYSNESDILEKIFRPTPTL